MDTLDEQILKLIAENARIPFLEVRLQQAVLEAIPITLGGILTEGLEVAVTRCIVQELLEQMQRLLPVVQVLILIH